MKRTSILYALLIVLLLPACYDDLGNYDYHEINELEVDSIHPLYKRGYRRQPLYLSDTERDNVQ